MPQLHPNTMVYDGVRACRARELGSPYDSFHAVKVETHWLPEIRCDGRTSFTTYDGQVAAEDLVPGHWLKMPRHQFDGHTPLVAPEHRGTVDTHEAFYTLMRMFSEGPAKLLDMDDSEIPEWRTSKWLPLPVDESMVRYHTAMVRWDENAWWFRVYAVQNSVEPLVSVGDSYTMAYGILL